MGAFKSQNHGGGEPTRRSVAPARGWITWGAGLWAWVAACTAGLRYGSLSFNAGVVVFSAGIALYFALPFEPDFWVAVAAGLAVVALGIWAYRADMPFAGLYLCIVLSVLGLARAAVHSAAIAAPQLPKYERTFRVTGWVSEIAPSGNRDRYVIEVSEIEGYAREDTPRRLRIRVTKPPDVDIRAGQGIAWLVRAKAPPGPVVPNGYDPGRAAYFRSIGGFGFGLGAPELAQIETSDVRTRLRREWTAWRYGLAERIYTAAPPETAGLQAALLTGVRRYIPPAQTDALRIAGLAHILAISGLHMGLLAGGVFSFVTATLAAIPPLARRYDVRKFAAIAGMFAATGYLILSGASVATQRAFIMVMIVFLAVILDRRAVSMRSVCVAAAITLWWHPEALVSVGFQMSFAAVAALVFVYQTWQSVRPSYSRPNARRRFVNFFGSLSVTSAVAGLATAGFALFHFNRIARYGLLGNLLAMPIFSLAVMPLAVVSLLFLPLGWESWPLAAMGWCLTPILVTSDWVAQLPGALGTVQSAPPWVLALFSAGFVGLCLGGKFIKLTGTLAIVAAMMAWGSTNTPDLRISDSGQVAFWGAAVDDETPDLFVGRRRSDSYGRSQFAQRAGYGSYEVAPYSDKVAQCDKLACRTVIAGKSVSIVNHPSEVITECANSDLVLLTVRRAGPVARRGCKAALLDARDLSAGGGHDVYLSGDIKLVPSQSPARAKRPWG